MIARGDEAGSFIVGIKALLTRAHTLGLLWGLRYATVDGVGAQSNTQSVPVVVDGDTVAIRAVSLIGTITAKQRVAIVTVPPSGVYIIGALGNPLGGAITVRNHQSGAFGTSSTTYVPLGGANTCGVAFVAPPSGTVLIHHSTAVDTNTAGSGLANQAPQVRMGDVVGSGTIVHAATDEEAVQFTGIDDMRAGVSVHVSGLTAGNKYNVELLHKAGGGATATFARRDVIVSPVIA